MCPAVAHIRNRTRDDGTEYFQVCYRVGGWGSRQSSVSFDDEKQAKQLCALVDSHGWERALELAGIADTQRPMSALTVAEWLDRHIGSLSGVEKKTVTEYERYAESDIGPVLGAIPLSKHPRRHCRVGYRHAGVRSGGRDDSEQTRLFVGCA